MPAFVDAEAAARDWINSLAALVGTGNPLTKGIMLTTPRNDPAAWAELQVTSGSVAFGTENPDHRAGLSFLVYGRTREAAAMAAVALANELEALNGAPVRANNTTVCLVADNVSGPVYSPEPAGPRYVVGCDLYLRAG